MRAFSLALVLAFVPACADRPAPREPTPVPVPAGTFRYFVGGDSRDDSAHVLPWAFRHAKARGASAFLFLGDMELTPQLDKHFRAVLPLLDPVPFYPVIGNHEVKLFGFASVAQKHAEHEFREDFLGTPRTPVKSALERKIVYSVDLPGGLHFVALDNVSQKGFGADQLAWLGADLTAARANPQTRHVVVGMHKPLAKNGISKHGMDRDGPTALAESDDALALFLKANVSLIVASHVHRFAHYDHGGIPSYITGGLGAPLDRLGPESAFHHVLALDVTDGGIAVDVLKFDGTPSVSTKDHDDDDD